ncbi:MAG: FkbM family methyltransferase [Minisyncoccia bacterium]
MTDISFKRITNKIRWYFNPKYKKSYSQNGEDIIISRIFKNLNIHNGFYIDVGTNHPKIYNNTYSLYKSGMTGICIEPDVDLCNKIKQIRPRDMVKNIGISDKSGNLSYFAFKTKEYNTFSKEEAEKSIAQGLIFDKKYDVPVTTLENILRDLLKVPDLISLDIEGYDEQVIKSFDFTTYRPIVWCIETITRKENLYVKNTSLIEYMVSKGYTVFADTHINTIFVENKSMEIIMRVN